jgi:hypothetical protein
MTRQRSIHGAPIALAAAMVLSLVPAWAAAPGFQAELDPCPSTPATRADVVGAGTASASLDGNTLTVTGQFTDLSSQATSAHLRMGLAMGVPGPVIGELRVPHEVAGAISGTLTLSPEQLAALRRNSVYIQIESIKAPDGALWGWLEVPHQP